MKYFADNASTKILISYRGTLPPSGLLELFKMSRSRKKTRFVNLACRGFTFRYMKVEFPKIFTKLIALPGIHPYKWTEEHHFLMNICRLLSRKRFLRVIIIFTIAQGCRNPVSWHLTFNLARASSRPTDVRFWFTIESIRYTDQWQLYRNCGRVINSLSM